MRCRGVLAAGLLAAALAGCGAAERHTNSARSQLLAEMRPIGAGHRFHPPVSGRPTGGCGTRPGRLRAHIELFAANRVVLIPAGVGRRGRCVGDVATLDPTGIVHFRAGATLAELFRAWGQPLSAKQLLSFHGPVRFYLAGRRVSRPPALADGAEIVIEVGPFVPPHHSFTFPPGL